MLCYCKFKILKHKISSGISGRQPDQHMTHYNVLTSSINITEYIKRNSKSVQCLSLAHNTSNDTDLYARK